MDKRKTIIFGCFAVILIIYYVMSVNNTIISNYIDSINQLKPMIMMPTFDYQIGNLVDSKRNISIEKKKLAVLVPFRYCFEELLLFAPHMKAFLSAQEIPHHIFILNQVDSYRFNRASLMNVGFLYTKEKFDYLVIHDVDFLPLNKKLLYEYPNEGVYHVLAPWLHPENLYLQNLGGILIVTNKDFERVNGMSNQYWGWGGEDDEFRVNVEKFGIKINRPVNITTGTNDTFRDIHSHKRSRDSEQCLGQNRFQYYERKSEDGLNTTTFKIKELKDHTIDGALLTIIDVELYCNRNVTPWCECSASNTSET